MEIKTINNRSRKVILFFAGWDISHQQFEHLKGGDYDIVIFNDYTNINADIYNIVKSYKQINVIACGAGVWAASATFDKLYYSLSAPGKFRIIRLLKKMGKAIAIDGTLCPVSNIWGIPQQKFNIMAEQNQRTLKELKAFNENYLFSNAIVWSKAVISRDNPVFPAANQERFWSEYNLCTDRNKKLVFNTSEFSIVYNKKSHFPFEEYEKWDSILDL